MRNSQCVRTNKREGMATNQSVRKITSALLSGFSKKFTTVTADEKVLALRVEAFRLTSPGFLCVFEEKKNSQRELFLLNFKALAELFCGTIESVNRPKNKKNLKEERIARIL